ncbi:MAG: hypothetical protein K2G55_03340 [Lachnospiraceae bacterium]|nr:hypothetical protein [Lachnospiraceae bacterium]MDE7203063.1 hypothetical protein [Lachnospiraceae bacterium]
MMEYIKLLWEHDLADEPTSILYEVNAENERLAERSIDIYRDGRTNHISDPYAGVIEITPIPTVEEFNSNIYGEEFRACQITKEEFDRIWDS